MNRIEEIVYAYGLSEGLQKLGKLPTFRETCLARLNGNSNLYDVLLSTGTAILYDGKSHFKTTNDFDFSLIHKYPVVSGALRIPIEVYDKCPAPSRYVFRLRTEGFLDRSMPKWQVLQNLVLLEDLFEGDKEALTNYVDDLLQRQNKATKTLVKETLPIFVADETQPAMRLWSVQAFNVGSIVNGDCNIDDALRFVAPKELINLREEAGT